MAKLNKNLINMISDYLPDTDKISWFSVNKAQYLRKMDALYTTIRHGNAREIQLALKMLSIKLCSQLCMIIVEDSKFSTNLLEDYVDRYESGEVNIQQADAEIMLRLKILAIGIKLRLNAIASDQEIAFVNQLVNIGMFRGYALLSLSPLLTVRELQKIHELYHDIRTYFLRKSIMSNELVYRILTKYNFINVERYSNRLINMVCNTMASNDSVARLCKNIAYSHKYLQLSNEDLDRLVQLSVNRNIHAKQVLDTYFAYHEIPLKYYATWVKLDLEPGYEDYRIWREHYLLKNNYIYYVSYISYMMSPKQVTALHSVPYLQRFTKEEADSVIAGFIGNVNYCLKEIDYFEASDSAYPNLIYITNIILLCNSFLCGQRIKHVCVQNWINVLINHLNVENMPDENIKIILMVVCEFARTNVLQQEQVDIIIEQLFNENVAIQREALEVMAIIVRYKDISIATHPHPRTVEILVDLLKSPNHNFLSGCEKQLRQLTIELAKLKYFSVGDIQFFAKAFCHPGNDNKITRACHVLTLIGKYQPVTLSQKQLQFIINKLIDSNLPAPPSWVQLLAVLEQPNLQSQDVDLIIKAFNQMRLWQTDAVSILANSLINENLRIDEHLFSMHDELITRLQERAQAPKNISSKTRRKIQAYQENVNWLHRELKTLFGEESAWCITIDNASKLFFLNPNVSNLKIFRNSVENFVQHAEISIPKSEQFLIIAKQILGIILALTIIIPLIIEATDRGRYKQMFFQTPPPWSHSQQKLSTLKSHCATMAFDLSNIGE